jgi:dienelactone hydrolase
MRRPFALLETCIYPLHLGIARCIKAFIMKFSVRALLSICALTFFAVATGSLCAQAPATHEPDPIAQSGRKALTDYLNTIGYAETAARRAEIAKITTRAQAEARQRIVRGKILGLLGALPQRVPLNSRNTGSTTLPNGVRVDKVMFDSQPNFPVTALLYTPPDSGTQKFPAIVMAPGHGATGKASDVAMATQFALAGFVVLSYDPIGQGERMQYLDPKSPQDKPVSLATRPTGEHGEAGLQPTLIGDALARYFLWDGMRAVDYLLTVPNVDPARIGAFGCSGGGTMTALLAAMDTRVAVAGVACYTTSFDQLLISATGVQDSEQSSPNFIAWGLDFPDWSELHAPKPYAIIATTSDMFPFAGAQATFNESHNFYSLFGAADNLAFITGPGGHGNLRPITPQILKFFADHLHPDAAYAKALPPLTDPFDEKANPPRKPPAPGEARPTFPPPPPASLVQVTPTGQLSSSYPGVATVFTLNQARAKTITTPHPATRAALALAIRKVAHVTAQPQVTASRQSAGQSFDVSDEGVSANGNDDPQLTKLIFSPESSGARGFLVSHNTPSLHDGVLLLTNDLKTDGMPTDALKAKMLELAKGGTWVLALQPRPSPPGAEETKSPILGTYYLTELRAELVGKTLLGLRVDDVIQATNYLAGELRQYSPDPGSTAPVYIREAMADDPHLGLVLLHAAVLDSRFNHVTVHGVLPSYRVLVDTPMPLDAPQDILPGVLRQYDVRDLVHVLGSKVSIQ